MDSFLHGYALVGHAEETQLEGAAVSAKIQSFIQRYWAFCLQFGTLIFLAGALYANIQAHNSTITSIQADLKSLAEARANDSKLLAQITERLNSKDESIRMMREDISKLRDQLMQAGRK